MLLKQHSPGPDSGSELLTRRDKTVRTVGGGACQKFFPVLSRLRAVLWNRRVWLPHIRAAGCEELSEKPVACRETTPSGGRS